MTTTERHDVGTIDTGQPSLTVVIPTYRRSDIVLDTIRQFREFVPTTIELVIVDQTLDPPEAAAAALARYEAEGMIRWLRLAKPSIPAAMNEGLRVARGSAVLFLDDDIRLGPRLVPAHQAAQKEWALVAGQVLQPGESTIALEPGQAFRFNSAEPATITEFMGGNFSVDRAKAMRLGGFDENFVGAAYRFEAEFAHRYMQAFGPIRYEPHALIHHLAVSSGGTRAHGHHLRTAQPSHSVGAYYFLLRARPRHWLWQLIWRPMRAIRTRHHLRQPWWIPVTLVAELRGLAKAVVLAAQGPRLPFSGPTT